MEKDKVSTKERLTAFLEEEKKKYSKELYGDEYKIGRGEFNALHDHDTRLINTLLDILGEEIDKLEINAYDYGASYDYALGDVKQILTNLKRKI